MEEIKITIFGDPATKKNSQRIISVRGRPMIIPSARYKAYEKNVLAQVHPESKRELECRVNVKCEYYMRTRRRVDLANLLEATTDALVRAGVFADDNSNIIAGHDGSRVYYNKIDPRVEVTISELLD